MRVLIDRGVIGDFRASDVTRSGFTPVRIDRAFVIAPVDMSGEVLRSGASRDPACRTRSRVTW